jgi:molecular chaperone HtpG
MSPSIEECSLMKHLRKRNPTYYGKILEVRKNIEKWLSYVPLTFPNYTRHTIEHSDEIVLQLSKLLFVDDDHTKPVVKLSSIEDYILIAAAYLHDVGMVVSDGEKAEILASEDWQRFISDGNPGAKRWKALDRFRKGSTPRNDIQRNFLADVQTRFLIAEFIRRTHHRRVADIIAQHEFGLGAFSFGDPVLKETITNVCVAHGLSQYELLDAVRFPERRDIQNETANVRFLAILLRIGDLLDMSSDRACPLLLNVSSFIPADSLAHWTKYQRITHRLTAPDKIELYASCQNQDEHRFLNDWCQWLSNEIKEAGGVMSRALRHSQWRPPDINLEGEAKTIKIEPDSHASYIPSKWRFVLEEEVVFERLVKDVYDHPLAFVRELVQNAVDATRCRLYLELKERGLDQPDFPTQVDKEFRNKYPIKISLSTRTLDNELSGAKEDYQILTVEDYGIGMDKNIIENYLLQVGRSYYTTDEFRRTYRFVPSSKFGIGFLSVFAVSDNVKIETNKPSSQMHDGPLQLTLTGPRNYLLTEKGTRRDSGTRIDVLMRKPMKEKELTKAMMYWCKRVEFPILVNDLATETTIEAERPEDLTYEIPVITQKNTKIKLKAYPIDGYGIEGEVYILSVIKGNLERWDMWSWVKYEYPNLHPAISPVRIPESIVCTNGIATFHMPSHYPYSYRVDIRRKISDLPVSRSLTSHYLRHTNVSENIPEVYHCVEKALLEHLQGSDLAKSKDGWRYKNKLVDAFEDLSIWPSLPSTVKVFEKGKPATVSLDRICNEQTVRLIIDQKYIKNLSLIKPIGKFRRVRHSTFHGLGIDFDDISFLSSTVKDKIFRERRCVSVELLRGKKLAMDWTKISEEDLAKYGDLAGDLIALENISMIGINVGNPLSRQLLNLRNPIINWLLTIKDACEKKINELRLEQFEKTASLLRKTISFATEYTDQATSYLKGWQETAGLPSELKPPSSDIREQMILDIETFYGRSYGRGQRKYRTKSVFPASRSDHGRRNE